MPTVGMAQVVAMVAIGAKARTSTMSNSVTLRLKLSPPLFIFHPHIQYMLIETKMSIWSCFLEDCSMLDMESKSTLAMKKQALG